MCGESDRRIRTGEPRLAARRDSCRQKLRRGELSPVGLHGARRPALLEAALGTVVGSATYKRAYIGFAKVDGKFEVGTE
jgi:hypothetical protein